jgi:hypothetical protein
MGGVNKCITICSEFQAKSLYNYLCPEFCTSGSNGKTQSSCQLPLKRHISSREVHNIAIQAANFLISFISFYLALVQARIYPKA